MPTREYLIRNDGAVLRRDINEYEVAIGNDLVTKIARDVKFKAPAVFEIDGMKVGLGIGQGLTIYSIALNRLMIRAPWHLNGNQILVPNFGSQGTDPVMTVTWSPLGWAPLMNLRLCVQSTAANDQVFGGAWLFAIDDKGIAWRLPIANVHEDCSCCTGLRNAVAAPTSHELVAKILQNFDQAQYNADLWRNVEVTQNFFRVTQNKDGFQTMAPAKPWTTYCTKVATNISALVV